MALRKRDIAVTHGLGAAVDSAKIGTSNPTYQLSPDLWINYPVQVQRILGVVVERRSYTHLVDFQPRLIIKVVKSIIVVAETSVGYPYIAIGPVVKRGSAPYILELLGYPALALISVFFIEEGTIPLQGFAGSHSQQADRFSTPLLLFVKAAKLFSQVFLMHPIAVVVKGPLHVDYIGVVWHRPHPKLRVPIIPRIPEHLVARKGGTGGHRKTDPVGGYFRQQPLEGPCDILGRYGILGFKILVEQANDPVRIMSAFIVHQQI